MLPAPKITYPYGYGLASNKELSGKRYFVAVWEPEKKASYYQIQLSKTKKFKNANHFVEKDSAMNYFSTYFGTYYLRVRAVDKKGKVGKWSKTLIIPKVCNKEKGE